jgi:CBS domain-containing protein
MKVKDVMTSEPVAFGSEAPLKDVARILTERGISGVPVVSERGIVLGVVSEADILFKEQGKGRPQSSRSIFVQLLDQERVRLQTKLAARTAGEAMTSPAITITPERPVTAAASLMIEKSVNRLPVVERGGKLVGIVTRADLVRVFGRSDPEIVREIQDEIVRRSLWLPAESVQVASRRGEVTLEGQVETRLEAELLHAFVERLPGVVAVNMNVTWPRDVEARRSLEEA